MPIVVVLATRSYYAIMPHLVLSLVDADALLLAELKLAEAEPQRYLRPGQAIHE